MKKALIITGVLAVAVGIVATGIFLRGRGGAADTPDGAVTPPPGTLPVPIGGAGSEGADAGVVADPDGNSTPAEGPSATLLSRVSQAAVLDYAINPQDGLIVIDAGGAVISISGEENIIARANFGGISGAWFSADGKWLLVRSGTAESPRWSLLNVDERSWRDVPANTDEMVWSPTGGQLAYFARRIDGSALTTFDPEEGTTRSRLSLSAPDLSLRWITPADILIIDKPSSLAAGGVWKFSLGGDGLALLAKDVPGADVIWGDDEGLLFTAGPTGGRLSFLDIRGEAGRVANFLTLPSKCVFGKEELNEYLFCAIPQDASLLKDSQLPDDYLKGKFSTADALFAIDLVNGAFLPITAASRTFVFDAANMKVYGSDLYFTDRNTRKLYRASLAEATGTPAEGEELEDQ